jgi:hypothetical protein
MGRLIGLPLAVIRQFPPPSQPLTPGGAGFP